MNAFQYRRGILHTEEVPLPHVANCFGTPAYVYSRAMIEDHWRAFDEAFDAQPHLVCYAVKANSNLGILSLFAHLGSGFDVVSGGELERVIRAGGEPSRVVFSGVGKQAWELKRGLEVGIRTFNVESEAELNRLEGIARELGARAPVSIRVNPDVDAGTHPYISTGLKEDKFGVDIATALTLYTRAAHSKHLRITGINCHIGSQLTRLEPLRDALEQVVQIVDQLAKRGVELEHLNVGGGLGIRYREENPPTPVTYVQTILNTLGDRAKEILIEPGRAIVGDAGILLTRVEYLKRSPWRNFAIVDAAMNDLLRPALYGGWHKIQSVTKNPAGQRLEYDIVGSICESADFLGKQRLLALDAGDLLVVRSAGAYGFVMSSNYNSRPRAPELLIDGKIIHEIRRRETIEQLFREESCLPE